MSSLPKISAIIPTYNSASYLPKAIESIMHQEYGNLEIIVVDDGSTDRTSDVLEKLNLPVTYYYQNQSGAGAARNFGVEHSDGEYIAFLDADDVWPQNKLHRQLDYFLNNSYDIVFTMISQFLDESSKHSKLNGNNADMPGICTSTMFMRRERFLEIACFKTSYRIGEFMEWFARAKSLGATYGVDETLKTMRRIHDNNTSARLKDCKKDYLAAIYEGLRARERASS